MHFNSFVDKCIKQHMHQWLSFINKAMNYIFLLSNVSNALICLAAQNFVFLVFP